MKKFSKLLALGMVLISSVNVFGATTEHYTSRQNVTAYIEPDGNRGSGGSILRIGDVAVHPAEWGKDQALNPIFPYGTMVITRDEPIQHPTRGALTTFYVRDTGDLENKRGLTKWWIDVFFGNGTEGSWIHQQASNFDIQVRDLKWIEVN